MEAGFFVTKWRGGEKNMKKILLLAAMVFAFALPVSANKANGPSAYNGLTKGNSGVDHLYLYEKDADWNVVDHGAFGKLTMRSGKFVFNAHMLEPNTEYALVVYDQVFTGYDGWPGDGPELLSGMTNGSGDLHLKGVLPENFEDWTVRIWLVLGSDWDGEKMTGWNQTEYLYEYSVYPMPTP